MNKRQRKKRILRYWRLADYPYVKKWIKGLPVFPDYYCYYCGFSISSYNDGEIEKMGGERKYFNIRTFFDGNYSGREWEEKIKCPICKTKYTMDNSDV